MIEFEVYIAVQNNLNYIFKRMFTGEIVKVFTLSTDFIIKRRKNTILFYNTFKPINNFL